MKLLLRITGVFLFLGAFLVSCKKFEGLKDKLTIAVDMPEPAGYVHIKFFDAATGLQITDRSVQVDLSGPGTSKLYSMLNERKDRHASVLGMLDLVVDPRLKGQSGAQGELAFNLTASLQGYATAAQRVVIPDLATGWHDVRVYMVRLDALPQGVSKVELPQFAQTAANGQVQTTTKAELQGGRSSMTVSAGTVMKDAAGKPVSGAVTAQILHYGTGNEQSLRAFPGGMLVQTVLPGGQTKESLFATAGLFDITLTAGGSTVKTFEGGGVTLRTELAPDMRHTLEGRPVRAGDEIKLWSREDGSLTWQYEKTAVVKGTTGALYLEETIPHLSDWSFSWDIEICPNPVKIEIEEPTTPTPPVTVTAVPFKLAEQNTFIPSTSVRPAADLLTLQPKLFLPSLLDVGYPASIVITGGNSAARFHAQDFRRGQDVRLLGSVQANGGSGDALTYQVAAGCPPNQTVTLQLESDGQTAVYPLELHLTVSSAGNSNVKIKPSLSFYMRPKGTSEWQFHLINKGVLATNIVVGTEYELMGTLGENYGTGSLKVTESGNNQLSVSISAELSYNNTANSRVETRVIDRPVEGTPIKLSSGIVVPAGLASKLGL